MKKHFIKKAVAILVGIIVIAASLVGALGIFAEDTATDAQYGTEADGISRERTWTRYTDIATVDSLQNGDFSEGLKYWGPKNDQMGLASAQAKVEDGKLVLTPLTTHYAGVRSVNFKLDGVTAGDTIVLFFNFKHSFSNSKSIFGFKLYENTDITSTEYSTTEKTIKNWSQGKVAYDKLMTFEASVTGNNSVFYIEFQVAKLTGTETTDPAYVDDIVIAKKNADGTYTDVATGNNIDPETGKPVVTTPPSGGDEGEGTGTGSGTDSDSDAQTPVNPADDPAKVGTYEGGLPAGSTGDDTNAKYGVYEEEGVYNLDFEQGFKYWAVKGNAKDDLCSQYVDLKTEGENNYIQFKGNFPNDYGGMRTIKFKVSDTLIKEGDEIAIIYDFKGDSPYQFRLDFAGMAGMKALKESEILIDAADANGWYTAITTTQTIAERTAGTELGQADSGYYVLSPMIQCSGDKTMTNAFDNLRIVKVVGGKYYGLDGKEIVIASTSTGTGSTTGSGTGASNGTGAGTGSGTSATTGDSVFLLAALLFVSGAGIVVAKRTMKSR